MQFHSHWRGAGAVERDGLENRCAHRAPRVRIPPSPNFFLEALSGNNLSTSELEKIISGLNHFPRKPFMFIK